MVAWITDLCRRSGSGPRTDTQTRLRSGLFKPLREASRRVVRPRDQPDGIRCARRIMTKNLYCRQHASGTALPFVRFPTSPFSTRRGSDFTASNAFRR